MFGVGAEHRVGSDSRRRKRQNEKKNDDAGAIHSDAITAAVIVHGLPTRNLYWEVIGRGEKGCEFGISVDSGAVKNNEINNSIFSPCLCVISGLFLPINGILFLLRNFGIGRSTNILNLLNKNIFPRLNERGKYEVFPGNCRIGNCDTSCRMY
jgi:hypothetical protein